METKSLSNGKSSWFHYETQWFPSTTPVFFTNDVFQDPHSFPRGSTFSDSVFSNGEVLHWKISKQLWTGSRWTLVSFALVHVLPPILAQNSLCASV